MLCTVQWNCLYKVLCGYNTTCTVALVSLELRKILEMHLILHPLVLGLLQCHVSFRVKWPSCIGLSVSNVASHQLLSESDLGSPAHNCIVCVSVEYKTKLNWTNLLILLFFCGEKNYLVSFFSEARFNHAIGPQESICKYLLIYNSDQKHTKIRVFYV